MRSILLTLVVAAWQCASCCVALADDSRLETHVLPLFKSRCVKCHGPAKSEGKLNLSGPKAVARGGKAGPSISPGDPQKSLLWQRIDSDEMPPDEPLLDDEKALIREWIASGAQGLPAVPTDPPVGADHWAFQPLAVTAVPAPRDVTRVRNDVDRFIQHALEPKGLTLGPEADRRTLVRRVCFDLTGLPATPEEISAFQEDDAPNAYSRMVDRYLASPHYGERWGKYWLDVAGYADSNGYFNADTDRPLAYRYRDYVVRSFNRDKPFDRFLREQLAGDEISGFVPGNTATEEAIELLEATHYLRNGQDGTGESDGNPDEVRVDRYAALESTLQIVASSVWGLTFQCAKCHDHKFEPISQKEYYQLQSVFYPALNIQNWVKPNERFLSASRPGELELWETKQRTLKEQIAALRQEFVKWVHENRQPGEVRFKDDFEGAAGAILAERWSNQAPGDDGPGGSVPVNIDSAQAPGASVKEGTLQIIDGGGSGDRWISTRQSFDWTPDEVAGSIQVTFDLIDNKVDSRGTPAERIAYFIALHDFNDNSPVSQGNILVDGIPEGGASVHLDYPGADSKHAGDIGTSGYAPGHNYGVKVTNVGEGKYRLEQLVDWIPEEKTLKLSAADLPDGGFGFEFCCGRSFVVDNVLVEVQHPEKADSKSAEPKSFAAQFDSKRKEYDKELKAKRDQLKEPPGKISCVFERSAAPPDVFLMVRGNYAEPGEKVTPEPLGALADHGEGFVVQPPSAGVPSSGRRAAWSEWITRPGSRSAALFARVQANRIWQQHFGTGIVATPENLGASGAAPSHPELLDWLSAEFIRSGWSVKAMHRLLLNSGSYRQSGALQPTAFEKDPANRLLWRFSLRRLDAEAVRDAMLAVSGQLDDRLGGPYVPTNRTGDGEVVVDEGAAGAMRRSLYLYQRRTQVLSLLSVFDAPSIVFNCTQRAPSTIPLQSLSLLNSEFAVKRARKFAERLAREAGNDDRARIDRAFLLAVGKHPEAEEAEAAERFVETQRQQYFGQADAAERAWSDLCQALLASNAFLYVE